MFAESMARAFWPLWSVVIFALGLLMLGLHDTLDRNLVLGIAASLGIVALWAGYYGLRRMSWPRKSDALARLDATLAGQPIAAVLDDQVIGSEDAGSIAVWRAHRARMAAAALKAQAVAPDLRVAKFDLFGLRFIALLVFFIALVFGSFGRVASVTDIASGGSALAAGPTWEGWVEPPAYTGKPSLYLADIKGVLEIPQGSLITLRLYGEVGALRVSESVSQSVSGAISPEATPQENAPDPAIAPEQSMVVAQNGKLEISGPNGRSWQVEIQVDRGPIVQLTGAPEVKADGTMSQKFSASDDYEVISGTATVSLDLAAVDRRFGLAIPPEARDALLIDLPMPITGSRAEFTETIVENFSEHPWANLPVSVTLSVVDAKDQSGKSPITAMVLPGRRFFDPLAASIIELRRDLLWSRENAPRVAQLIRAVTHLPEGLFRKDTDYLRLRIILRRLETMTENAGLKPGQRDEITAALWDLALRLEDGDLSDALERMRRAQERLSEAIKNGATDEEIADLMQELREATRDFMRQRATQQAQEGQQGQNPEDAMRMTQQDIQDMMDRIQELMEQGRTAEAQQALEEFQEMMENMRVTQGGEGGEQSAGQQAMEDLSDTLKEQQGLTDQAFRDLQEQFNPNANAGESQDNEGQSGGQGRGESHEGQGDGEGEGETAQGQQQGQQGGQAGESNQQQSLADRQQALRDELERQQQGLPGAGTPEGDAAREALGRAEQAMEGAENALRGNDLAEAIDQQAQAMEALRDGIRNLGEAMAQQERERSGQQGQASGENGKQGQQDPLGRSNGARAGGDENLLQGEDVYRRARKLLDEIRRRSGDSARPDVELEYLKRLLERF
ncbi:MAG: TIGR02302 family protein [Rhodobacterales bacterium]|nr:TIGR02302 family protein [Rhodobacterales bacterium]